MRNIIFGLAAFAILSSCNNDENPEAPDNTNELQIHSYHSAYARYPITISPNPDPDNRVLTRL